MQPLTHIHHWKFFKKIVDKENFFIWKTKSLKSIQATRFYMLFLLDKMNLIEVYCFVSNHKLCKENIVIVEKKNQSMRFRLSRCFKVFWTDFCSIYAGMYLFMLMCVWSYESKHLRILIACEVNSSSTYQSTYQSRIRWIFTV